MWHRAGQFRYPAAVSLGSPKVRRLASLAFLAALLVLATRTCKGEMATAEIRFTAESTGPSMRALDVQLYRADRPDEVVGFFKKSYKRGAKATAGTWPLTADAGSYRLAIEVTTESGNHRFDRHIDLREGARIIIDLDTDL